MHPIDLAVVAAYLLLTLGVGLWFARGVHNRSADDYLLGARNLPAWSVMLSMVATETPALTASTGMPMALVAFAASTTMAASVSAMVATSATLWAA